MEDFLTHGLAQLISAVGFPIVVAIALYYQNTTLSANYQKMNQQFQDKIDNNTLILTRLVEKLHEDVLLDEQIKQPTNSQPTDSQPTDSQPTDNQKTNNEKTDKK